MDAVAIEEQLRKKREEQQQSTSRGAGAILFSSLVYQGWRFPSFVLVDTDERYLFELEVKVKLSHVNCGSALMDCLVEYPPHALLSRAGLLQAMLDVLGSSEGTKEDFGKPRTHPAYHLYSYIDSETHHSSNTFYQFSFSTHSIHLL